MSDDVGRRYTFNTAIAGVMELMNSVTAFSVDSTDDQRVRQEALETAVLLLSPITPHIAHELWLALGHDEAVVNQSWPKVDESALTRDTIEFVVQVNGKLRARLTLAADASREAVEAAALADANVQQFVEGKTVRKVIVVPNKLVNLVV